MADDQRTVTWDDYEEAESRASQQRQLAEGNREAGRYAIANAQYASYLAANEQADTIRETLEPGWRDDGEPDVGYHEPDLRAADIDLAWSREYRTSAAAARERGETHYAGDLERTAANGADRSSSIRAADRDHRAALGQLTDHERTELRTAGSDAHSDTLHRYQLARTAAEANAADYARARHMERTLFGIYDYDAALPVDTEGDSGIAAGEERLSQFLRTHPGLRSHDHGHFASYYAHLQNPPPRHADPLHPDQREQTLEWIRDYAPEETWGMTDEQAERFAQETLTEFNHWSRVQESGTDEERAAAEATLNTSVLTESDTIREEAIRDYAPDETAGMSPVEAIRFAREVDEDRSPSRDPEMDRRAARHSNALHNADRAAAAGDAPEALRWAALADEAEKELTGEADQARWEARRAEEQLARQVDVERTLAQIQGRDETAGLTDQEYRDPRQSPFDEPDSGGNDWRRAAEISYRELVTDYGNDGDPRNDRHLSDDLAAERAAALDRIADRTGVDRGTLLSQTMDAAYQHGQDPGTDEDPDRFAPPDFDALRDRDRQQEARSALSDRARDTLTDEQQQALAAGSPLNGPNEAWNEANQALQQARAREWDSVERDAYDRLPADYQATLGDDTAEGATDEDIAAAHAAYEQAVTDVLAERHAAQNDTQEAAEEELEQPADRSGQTRAEAETQDEHASPRQGLESSTAEQLGATVATPTEAPAPHETPQPTTDPATPQPADIHRHQVAENETATGMAGDTLRDQATLSTADDVSRSGAAAQQPSDPSAQASNRTTPAGPAIDESHQKEADPATTASEPVNVTAHHLSAREQLAQARASLGRVDAATAEMTTRDAESASARGRDQTANMSHPARSYERAELSQQRSTSLGSDVHRGEPTSYPTSGGQHL